MPLFEGAREFAVYNSLLVDASPPGLDIGWKLLTEASLFNATHDSAAQAKLSRCLPATQDEGLVKELDDLINGGRPLPYALVFSGPMSDLAHLCAKRLEDCLCASFFVSQSLKTSDDVRLFPTIAYQLSRKFPAYSDLLMKTLRDDPSILYKTLEVQFKKLIADPFRELLETGKLVSGAQKVIVVDGLQDYAEVQTRLDILQIISSKAAELPFVWLIFCRPDTALDRQVVELGSTAGIHWGEGYPALQTRAYPRGSIHSFLLTHSQSCFIAVLNFKYMTIVLLTSFYPSLSAISF